MSESNSGDPTVQQLFDLSGKVALISGASGYLGTALSRALAEAGASVIATSRDLERAQEAAGSLPGINGARHHAIVMDQCDPESIESAFAEAIEA